MGQITTEIRADSTTQVKQIVSNLYDGPYNLEITVPFYRQGYSEFSGTLTSNFLFV
jgi:hypothetical protein